MIAAGDQDGDRGPVVGHHGLKDGEAVPQGRGRMFNATGEAAAMERLLDREAARFEAGRLAMPGDTVEPGTTRQ